MALSIKEQIQKIKQRKSGAGEKTRKGGLSFKPSSGNRYVLFIGDEGAILVYMKGSAVQSRQFVPDASMQSLGEFRQTLSKDQDAPILMVLDNMDQTYLQQTLPPVSSLSVSKLVKRRLDREFGSMEIKGALTLGRETTGRKDWNFIMVAVEKNPQLTAWLEFVEALPNHFRGIRLLSVEAENIVKYIDRSAGINNTDKEPKWKFFVSHNKVGGFRQVILRNGRIVFTRLAQPIGESNTEMVAGNIEQEMQSTIEYMKRLSFNAQEGLAIYIVASAGIKSSIDRNKFSAAEMHVFTPYELAQQMGIEGATQPTDQFGDVILAATIGCSRKFVLPLGTTLSKHVDQYRMLISAQRMVTGTLAVGIVGYAAVLGFDMFTMSQDAGDMEDNIRSQQVRVETLKQEINRSDIDIEKANDLLDLYIQLQKEKFSPAPFISRIMPIKQSPVWVKEINWQLTSTIANPGFLAGADKSSEQVELEVEFLDVIKDKKAFKLASKKVLDDLKSWLPGYDVVYKTLPAAFSENKVLSANIDVDDDESDSTPVQSGPVEAEISIKETVVTAAPPTRMPGMPPGMPPEMLRR